MQVVIDKERQEIADQLQQVLEEHGFDYEAPAWRDLIERGEEAGLEFELIQPVWLEEQ